MFAGRSDAASVTDDAGRELRFDAPPRRVVSLVSSATEIICALGASGSLAGVTYRDAVFEGTAGKSIVGGPYTPRFELIDALSPDLLIAPAEILTKIEKAPGARAYPVLAAGNDLSLSDAEGKIRMLGDIFGAGVKAREIIASNRLYLATTRLKTEKIPQGRKKKAMYVTLEGRELFTAGENSFQNEVIRDAGAKTHSLGEGALVPLELDGFLSENPDYIFTSSANYARVKEFLEREGWRDAAAVRNGAGAFPGALTGMASAHTGYFTAWLASEIYADEFADISNMAYPNEVISERPISLDVPYVKSARVVESRIMDFVHRTLLVDFKRPQRVVSTVSGERGGIETVGNSYSPPQLWSVYHKIGFGESMEYLFEVLKLDGNSADIMVTGADMDNAVVETAAFRDMKATAIVTGGVDSNALRTSKDTGAWYEPGTINIMVMTNHRLSEQAATRAIVTATEAKTAALWDMDIRSAQRRAFYPATGTGTDTVIIVAGEGVTLDGSGGHTKMGELIADTVYRGVQKAILRQNGKIPARSAIERLVERGVAPDEIVPGRGAEMEELLLSPKYEYVRQFLEYSFSLSDANILGQISGLGQFEKWALDVAREIAGVPVGDIDDAVSGDALPPALDIALDAIATGLERREAREGRP
jgi:ABC-type Fe3+-hydroxamate transport system substrate-binding protein/adenosylcobinamide amidohydrolase